MVSYLWLDIKRRCIYHHGALNLRNLVKILLADGTMAVILFRMGEFCARNYLGVISLLIYKISPMFTQAIIGRGARIGPGFIINHSNGVVINGKVVAGRNLNIDHQVTIGVRGQAYPVLGDNVFIGCGAKILGGVKIGSNVRIGANAVVVKDIPDNATAVGIPAKVVKIEPDRKPSFSV